MLTFFDWSFPVHGKRWLTVSIALTLTYTAYILWAKFAKVIGPPPIKLSETGEFLLFLAAVLAFTMQVFVEDARKSKTTPEPGTINHGGGV
jgi:hypothetical protein